MSSESTIEIDVKDLSVSYDGQIILDRIDLTMRRGEFVTLVGRSGSGKTTLLLGLAKLLPSRGRIEVDGEIGLVFQSNSVFPWLTVRSNIAFGLHKLHNKDAKTELVQRFLELVDLREHASKYPAQLSGGQVQRVAVAMAIAPGPAVIFMDEPFAALDTETREQMQAWLLDLNQKQQMTTLFVTHSIDEAIYLSDRILILGKGRITGEFAVPFGRPRTEDIRFTSAFGEFKETIFECLKTS